jgi:hypothetical protein
MATRGFPQFQDGDVEIYLSVDEKLVLHSSVLSIHSEWFKASLSERWATSETGTAAKAYELRLDKGSDEGSLLRRGTAQGKTEMISGRTTEGRAAVQRHTRIFSARSTYVYRRWTSKHSNRQRYHGSCLPRQPNNTSVSGPLGSKWTTDSPSMPMRPWRCAELIRSRQKLARFFRRQQPASLVWTSVHTLLRD